jgi:hypothetical protein
MIDRTDETDYVWHFRLRAAENLTVGPEALTQMVQQQLRALLRSVVLTRDGVDVKVTGFRFLDEPAGEHPLRPEVVASDSGSASTPATREDTAGA